MPVALPDALKSRGELSAEAIHAVLRSPALRGRQFAVRLFQSGLVPAETIFQTLISMGARDATDKLTPLPSPRLLALVPSRLADEGCLVPFLRIGNRLHVAMLDPSDDRAIEDLALFTGFVVEPYLARPRELFHARYEAYGIAPTTPLTDFHVAAALSTTVLPPPPSDIMPAIATRDPAAIGAIRHMTMPEPGEQAHVSLFGPAGDSPLLSSLYGLDPARLDNEPAPAPAEEPTQPAPRSTAVEGWQIQPTTLQKQVAGWSQLPETDVCIGPRDAVAGQVLPLLVPTFSRALLFLLRNEIAVGWDALGENISRERIRDVLLPLSPPSTLRLAATTRYVVTGNPQDQESVDRILLGFLGEPTPIEWLVLPLLAGNGVVGLLYADRTRGPLSQECRDLADMVADTLGESLHALYELYGRLI